MALFGKVSSCFAMCSFWQREEPPDGSYLFSPNLVLALSLLDERSEFYEGFFLDMLLNRLQRLLDQVRLQ